MGLVWSAVLAAAASSTPTASPPVKAPLTLQQQFDAATDAAMTGKCDQAIPLFEALERDPGLKPGSLAAAATSVRKGSCLIALGKAAEGEAAVLSGLPAIRLAGSSFKGDVIDALHSLGDGAFKRDEYGSARRYYAEALSQLTGNDRLGTLARLAKATAFDGDGASIGFADEGLRLLAANPDAQKDTQATFHTLRARTLLNQGQTHEAHEDLKKALRLSGGLTRKTTLAEVSMRGDLALAATLMGHSDEARRYLAYTGQGRITQSPFTTAVSMTAPECGAETGLRPEDFAVVEFGIGNDGFVAAAQTVYTRGNRATAAAFAQAVREWAWEPSSLEKIPLFYRASARVEIRCTNGAGGQTDTLGPVKDRFLAWSGSKLVSTDHNAAREEQIDSLQRSIPQLASAQDYKGEIAAIGLLYLSSPTSDQTMVDRLDRAIGLVGRAGAPAEIDNSLRIFRTLASQRSRMRHNSPSSYRRNFEIRRGEWLVFANQAPVIGDPVALATARLLAARRDSQQKATAETLQLVQQVADDQRLPAQHPLRQVAFLTLANRAAEQGDLAGAEALFQRTGLTEEQCALLGPVPSMKRTGVSDSTYPDAAFAYGFEGWVKLEFDISADGRAKEARPLIAYPPFVFAEAAAGMASGFRFERSYRPTASVACAANSTTVHFQLNN